MSNFTLSQKRVIRNMIEGGRAASDRYVSHLLMLLLYPPNQHAQNCQSL